MDVLAEKSQHLPHLLVIDDVFETWSCDGTQTGLELGSSCFSLQRTRALGVSLHTWLLLVVYI